VAEDERMSETEHRTRRRLWRVLGPVSLILTGVGWLAIGLVWGSRVVHRPRAVAHATPIRYATVSTGAGANGTYAVLPRRHVTRSGGSTLNPTTGHSYGVIDAPTWNAGQEMAARTGGRLVTIDDAAEQAWLVSTFGGGEKFWIGLTDVDHEGSWEWTNGQRPSYTNWAGGEPNDQHRRGENFAVMNWGHLGTWNDLNPEDAPAFGVVAAIVEWEPRAARATETIRVYSSPRATAPTHGSGRR
jgi:hypothetical protein